MDLSPYLELAHDEGSRVLTITLHRRDNERNQINGGLVAALKSVLEPELADSKLRGLILISKHEKVFSTGADIEAEMPGLTPAAAEQFSREGKQVFGLLASLAFPTVACLGGFCLGGGLELALCCDFRLAAKNARLGLPEVNLGLIPGWGGTQRLPRLIGRSRALRMILSGEPVNSQTALDYGLVDEIVESHAELPAAAARLLGRFTDKSPRILEMCKRAVYVGGSMTLADGLDNESRIFGLAWGLPDREEGLAAYNEKRKPKWPE